MLKEAAGAKARGARLEASPLRLRPVGYRTTQMGFGLYLGTLYSGYTNDPCGHRVLGCLDAWLFHMHCGMGRKAPWSTVRGNASYYHCPYNRLSRRLVRPGRTPEAPWPGGRGTLEEAWIPHVWVGVVVLGPKAAQGREQWIPSSQVGLEAACLARSGL